MDAAPVDHPAGACGVNEASAGPGQKIAAAHQGEESTLQLEGRGAEADVRRRTHGAIKDCRSVRVTEIRSTH